MSQASDKMFVEVNSAMSLDVRILTSNEITTQKSAKRKSHEDPTADSSDDFAERQSKKIKKFIRTKENDLSVDPGKIDNVLEETADKSTLVATNEKNILRDVDTNANVLAMRQSPIKVENNDDLEKTLFKVILTRSKVNELREKQHELPWPMSNLKPFESEILTLLKKEFSDESSSDEDYIPNEEECSSEEDIVHQSIVHQYSSSSSSPESDDDVGLVRSIPEAEPDAEDTPKENEPGDIAIRTRSKLPLNDTIRSY